MNRKWLIALFIVVLVIGGYLAIKGFLDDSLHQYANATRDAEIVSPDLDGSEIVRVEYVPQNWSPSRSMDYYTRPQGSLLIPYDWFLHLEQVGKLTLFRDKTNINRLRYLPQRPVKGLNPDGLPVGFVKERDQNGTPWLGLTCAACHTAQIHYNKVAYRIDGGPAMADMDTFMLELEKAMHDTLEKPDKFDRFAVALKKTTPASRDDLKKNLEKQAKLRREYNERNHSKIDYGYARLDAFGRIMNETLTRHIKENAQDIKVADAPVSYPFIWDAPHHDWVQWNGAANNHLVPGIPEIGALARNTGEMLGVFGEVYHDAPDAPGRKGFATSIRLHNLLHLEHVIKELQSPLWVDVKELPPLNAEWVASGKILFENHCASCHGGKQSTFRRDDPNRTIKAELTPQPKVNTDPRMANNFATRKGKTGILNGEPIGLKGAIEHENFQDTAPAGTVLVHVVRKTILGGITDPKTVWDKDPQRARDLYWFAKAKRERYDTAFMKLKDDSNDIFWGEYLPGFKPAQARDLMVYKARPLNGVWATAPYLHNGSVASLYELLLPADKRMPKFHVGSRQFNPKTVGFMTDPFEGSFEFDTTLDGNSNAGHEYGTSLSPDQRRDLLEYLKSL